MQEDSGSAGPRRPADPAAAGAKPVRIGVYDRPAAGGRRTLYLALAVIVVALIAWLLLAQRGAAASALLA